VKSTFYYYFMDRFIIAFLLSTLFVSTFAVSANPIGEMLAQKASLTKTGLNGEEITPTLKAHGAGLTDGQEKLILNIIDQAAQIHGTDIYSNALYIQQKVEDSFSGRWIVEVFGNDPSWGRASHIYNDQWAIYFGYGS
jgi:hypothetical protein